MTGAKLRRAVVACALAAVGVGAPGVTAPAQADDGYNGTWNFYGVRNPITSSWRCGGTANLGSPPVSWQSCIIKNSGYEQVAVIINERGGGWPVLQGHVHEQSSRNVYWNCGPKELQQGFNVCFGSSLQYTGTVISSGAIVLSPYISDDYADTVVW